MLNFQIRLGLLVLGLGLIAVQSDFLQAETGAADSEKKSTAVVIQASEYASLQAAIDALPTAGGMVVFPAGEIELQEPLIIRTERTRLTGAGAATHLINKNENGQPAIHIRADGYAEKKAKLWQVELDHFQISGNPKSGEGILAEGIQEIFVHGMSIHHNGTHGILMDQCYEDPRIADCLFTYNKKTGITILGGHDIVVNANHFEENQDAVHCIDSFNLTMNGNNLDDHLRHGVVIENTYGSVLSGNMIEECEGWGVILERDCYGITISANVIAHDMQGGIDLRDAWGCAVSANTFTIVHNAGVRVGPDSGRITISANNFSNSDHGGKLKRKMEHKNPIQWDVGNGVVLEETEDVVITGNLFSGMDNAAIRCEDEKTERVNIQGNIITDYGRRTQKDPVPLVLPQKESIVEANNIIGPAKLPRKE